ncbi:MAG: TIGR01620 family protein [Pseudomonadota bacterium]
MTRKPRDTDPVILDLDTTSLPDAPTPAQAPPVDMSDAETANRALTLAARRRGWGLGALAMAVLMALLGLIAVTGLVDFIEALFARHAWLGWLGAALTVLLAMLLLALAVRELAGLARLGRVERLQSLAAAGQASALLAGLDRLYRIRPDLERARQDLAKAVSETPDGSDRIALAERHLMELLDRKAEQEVARSARQVAAATALIPLTMVDVLAVLWSNLRMIRRIAELYGGRAGWLGSWRLMRSVAVHLLATGAVAATDDLLGPLVGGGVLGKLSRRFGEAAVNAALTARVGVAAIEICRPMPFQTMARPKASALVMDALRNWRNKPGEPGPE